MFLAAIALVDMDAHGLDTGERGQGRDDRAKRVAIEGIAV